MLELQRKNNLYVANGDAFDEQLAGFGDLIKEYFYCFKQAYGVTDSDDAPCFLEGIAMGLGMGDTSIKDAIYNLKSDK